MYTAHWPKRYVSLLLFACLSLCFRPTQAQQPAHPEASAPSAVSSQNVPTLDKVKALPPDDRREALDLYQFKNPISVKPSQFEKSYDAGISPEEMALKYGGYLNYGINMGLYIAFKGLGKLTGARPQIQSVTARPPPLNVEQINRAARLDTESAPAPIDTPQAAPPTP